MKPLLVTSIFILGTLSANAGLDRVRDLLGQKNPVQAATELDQMLAERPDDPWLLYNRAVAAYAAHDFAKADEIWQRLAGMQVPDQLRDSVWTQIGNVSFRIAEPAIEKQPDSAVAKLEQSREAYRVALAQNKRNDMAKKNLIFVEKQLETLYAKLSQRLVDDAAKESSADRSIEKLEAALEYQRNATALNPQELEHHKRENQIEQAISAKFTEKAVQSEKQADRLLEPKSLEQWRREEAQRTLEKALADFKQAESFNADNKVASEGDQRVTEKLATMLAQAGRQEQKTATEQAKYNPQQALERFEKALDNFDQALGVKPDHQDALAGQKEVKEAMEQLHLQQGDKLAKAGEEQAKRNPADAADKLMNALDHFEQARALNPENPEIPPRIEKVQKMLPDALVAMAQQEQQQAAKAEQASRQQQAVAHLEQAEAGFDKATELSPENQQAKAGQQQVQEDLARLRKELAEKANQKEQQQAKNGKQNGPSFQSMLAQMKARVNDREANARNHPGTKYEPPRSNGVRNW